MLRRKIPSGRRARLLPAALFLTVGLLGSLIGATASHAHEGPPYAITEKARAGNYELAVWVDPDAGEGKLWVVVTPASTGSATATTVAATLYQSEASAPARVVTGRLEPVGGVSGDRFVFDGPFDSVGRWDVQLAIAGSSGPAAYAFNVDVLPEGPQTNQIPFFLIPFAALAVLGVAALLRRKRKILI